MPRDNRLLRIFLFTLFLTIMSMALPLRAEGEGQSLLVWIGNGEAPGKHSASSPGQLALMDVEGNVIQPVMEVPAQTSRVLPCGEGATSPDGRHFTFFVGLDVGTLYMLTDTDTLFPVATELNALGCMGRNGFRYAPDSARFAYIAFEPTADADEFPDGWLHIAGTESKTDLASYPGVTAFDIDDDQVVFVRFFTTDQGEADEAGVFLWDGESDAEVATIYPQEDCRFTSAQVALLPGKNIALLMGHRCKTGDTATSWQFYQVDPSTRTATLSMFGSQQGAFFSYAQTNNLIVSPSGKTVYYTVPDGFTANTTALVAVDMAAVSPDNVVIPTYAVMPRYDGRPYNFANNALPVLSPDGRWLAVVTNTPNNEAVLQVVDLAEPLTPPIMFPAGRRGDTIADMDFTPDSSQLIFVAGGSDGGENSVFGIDLASGDSVRVRRGRYGRGVVSPDSGAIAIMEWQAVEDPKQPLYLTLALVELAEGQTTTLFEGATIVDGKVTEQRFAYPLAWRQNASP